MSRQQKHTLASYYEQYCVPMLVQNHIVWLNGYGSEVIKVEQCKHPKLYRVFFSDHTTVIVDHTYIVIIEHLSGTICNR